MDSYGACVSGNILVCVYMCMLRRVWMYWGGCGCNGEGMDVLGRVWMYWGGCGRIREGVDILGRV